MPYYPEGDPRNADPNVRPGDQRTLFGYDKNGNPVYDRPLSSGEIGENDDILDDAWAMVSDPFRTETARTGKVDGRDFFLGGDAQLRDQTLAATKARGEDAFETLEMRGTADSKLLLPYAQQQAMTGLDQYNALSAYAPQLTKAGGQALASGQYQASQAAGLGTELRGAANAVKGYGDQYQSKNWSEANSQMRNFAPSARAQTSAAALGAFDSGQVNANLQRSYDNFGSYVNQGPGPSAAEAQLRSGADEAMGNAVALARSGRNAGQSAQAMRQAAFQQAAVDSKMNADLATLRANEAATWRQQQLQGMAYAGNIAAQQEQARQAGVGMQLQGMQSAASLYGNQDAQRLQALAGATGQYGQMLGQTVQAQQAADATRQGYYGQALAGQQLAGNLSQSAYDTYLGSVGNAANVQGTAGQNLQAAIGAGAATTSNAVNFRQNALQNAFGTQAAYDQAYIGAMENEAQRRTTLANTRLAEDSANSRANQATDAQADQSLTSMAGAAIGALLAA